MTVNHTALRIHLDPDTCTIHGDSSRVWDDDTATSHCTICLLIQERDELTRKASVEWVRAEGLQTQLKAAQKETTELRADNRFLASRLRELEGR